MPRRKTKSFKRDIGVDARFQSAILQRMINIVLKKGKKNLAIGIVYEAMDIVKSKVGDDKKALYYLTSLIEKRNNGNN